MELYKAKKNNQTRWISFENQKGEKGCGAKENKGAKGHASSFFEPLESKTLIEVSGCGIINRIWMTVGNPHEMSPQLLRSIRIEMFWDNAKTPAVSAPLGDFFGVGLGRRVPFESALFSDPEGRSFNSYVKMPFRTHAKIIITNESKTSPITLFYDINYTLTGSHDDDVLYFHAFWNREIKTTLKKDFKILPKVRGEGLYLGANIGVITNPVYGDSWWGEGEVKVYLDGDEEFPTLAGTGTEDYPGSGYSIGAFSHMYQGCPIADNKRGQYAFYRYHVTDPVYFHKDCKVTMQQMGGCEKTVFLELKKNGMPLIPVTAEKRPVFIKLLETGTEVEDESIGSDFWVNFYREDDWSATAYFYLDSSENGLPAIASAGERTYGLSDERIDLPYCK